MDWNDLRYFLAVYRTGSSSAAARTLGVQHTTVGRRLAALEAVLGTSLFTRTPTGLTPTSAAADILKLAEDAEQSVLAIERQVRSTEGQIAGVVRLTTSDAFAGFFVRHLEALYAEHPALQVEVLTGNRNFDLAHGEADVAVRHAPTSDLDLISRKVGENGWSLYASDGYLARCGPVVTEGDFRGHSIVAFDGTLARTPGALWLAEHATAAHVALRGNSIAAVLNAAIASIGIAAVPCFLGDGEAVLRRLTPAVIGVRDVFIVYHPDTARIPRVRRVIDFAAAVIKAEAKALSGGVLDPVPASTDPASSDL